MSATPESRRLQVVQKDYDKSARSFAKILGLSPRSCMRMLNGEQDINYMVISVVCLKLGYSPNWFVLGIGDKKLKGNEAKLITEIQMLRTEMDITSKLNLRLQARLAGVEQEHADMKKEIEQIKLSLKK